MNTLAKDRSRSKETHICGLALGVQLVFLLPHLSRCLNGLFDSRDPFSTLSRDLPRLFPPCIHRRVWIGALEAGRKECREEVGVDRGSGMDFWVMGKRDGFQRLLEYLRTFSKGCQQADLRKDDVQSVQEEGQTRETASSQKYT